MLESKPHYLYKITNQINGKLYIGVTSNLEHRKLCHLKYHSHDRIVNKAVKKHGIENFTFEVICIGSKEYIYDLEIKAISMYNSLTSGHGYNLAVGGEGGKGGKRGPVESRSDDKFTYVSGFWFPNKRTAIKSLNWGFGIYQSRKSKGLLGETEFHPVRYGPQEPVFAAGFWFPSKKSVLDKLQITDGVYEVRRRKGTLGDVVQPPRESNSTALGVPNYYKGFWFPNLFIASEIFNKTPEVIRKYIKLGKFEENSKQRSEAPKRLYLIEGISFESLKDASERLKIPENTIKNRLSKNYNNYGYTYMIEETTNV